MNKTQLLRHARSLALGGVALLLLILITLQAVAIGTLRDRVENLQHSVGGIIDEVGAKLTIAEQLELFGKDMNELRALMFLPPKEYAVTSQTPTPAGDELSDDAKTSKGLFLLLDRVREEQGSTAVVEAARATLVAIQNDTELRTQLDAAGLRAGPQIAEEGMLLTLPILDRRNLPVRKLIFHRDTDEWELFSARSAVFFPTSEEALTAVRAFAKDAQAELARDAAFAAKVTQLDVLLAEPATTALLNAKAIRREGRSLKNAEGTEIANFRSGDTFTVSIVKTETTYATIEELRAALPAIIASLNAQTTTEANILARQKTLERAFQDPAFQKLLAEAGLTVETTPRIENDRIYYALKNTSGAVVRQLAIERNTSARVYVVDAQGVGTTTLEDLLDQTETPQETLPGVLPPLTRSAAEAQTFLVAGKHGSLTDTMILARVVPSKQTITLLSVPRDLYVQNRKINAIWMSFGMDELKRQLTKVTGYEIDHAILVDMYAFSEAVDLLGGIDVTLTERLIDPSYRTLDQGVWGTLSYEPGSYHLGGKEALRLARSRHYSSDFKRAERQHLLLAALQAKLKSQADASDILSMVKIGLDRTQTDMTPQQVMQYAVRFRDYRVNGGAVMSTGNILMSKSSNDDVREKTAASCAAITDPMEKEACAAKAASIDKGAYILLPRDNNWQLPKWYAWKTFEGEL